MQEYLQLQQRLGKAVLMEYIEQALGAAHTQQAQAAEAVRQLQARVAQLEAALGPNVVPFPTPPTE